jgi:hypothetical protein
LEEAFKKSSMLITLFLFDDSFSFGSPKSFLFFDSGTKEVPTCWLEFWLAVLETVLTASTEVLALEEELECSFTFLPSFSFDLFGEAATETFFPSYWLEFWLAVSEPVLIGSTEVLALEEERYCFLAFLPSFSLDLFGEATTTDTFIPTYWLEFWLAVPECSFSA